MNTIDFLRAFARHLEALGRLWQARLELLVSSWRAALERAEGRSVAPAGVGIAETAVRGVERALVRVSRFAPGVTCIHRALAARHMLADRGIDAAVVIGLRKRSGDLAGHAWIEVGRGDDGLRAFCEEGVDYVHLAPISHNPSTAAHQPQNPFISLLDDALHRLWGSILGF